MAFFSNWFKEPNTANSNDSEEYTQEESEIIETFLDKYDLEEEDLIEYQLIKRTPKAFALKQLGMANEDFLAFTRWKNSTLTERIRQSFGAITSFTHFNASLLAYKDKERTEGDKNIVNDQWKYISPQEHLQEAFLLLQYCINKKASCKCSCGGMYFH